MAKKIEINVKLLVTIMYIPNMHRPYPCTLNAHFQLTKHCQQTIAKISNSQI